MTIAGIGLALIITNIVLISSNRSEQQQINARQQYINQSAQLSRLNEEIIKSIALLSVKYEDAKLKGLLDAHGINFTVNAPQAQTAGVPK